MPDNFYEDTIKTDSRYNSATPCHDLALLEPVFRQQVAGIVEDAKAQGIELRPVETYRSQALQEHYFDAGTTQLRTVGVHHYGLACDLVVFRNGQPQWNVSYDFLGVLAKKHGIIWGGDWGEPNKPHSFRDYDHVQRISVPDQTKLFNGSWYPDASYTTDNAVAPPVVGNAVPPVPLEPPAPIVKQVDTDIKTPVVVTSIPAPAPAVDLKAAASAKLTGDEKVAFDTAVALNTNVFSNWFYLANIMAFIETESAFKFDAFRQEPSGVASYGCMQVLDITAAGLGFTGSPDEMYDPETGIHMGMMALCQNWNVLAKKMGKDPTIQQWVEAYNEGAGAVLNGKTDVNYWNVWSKNHDKWVGIIGDI